MRDGSGLCHRFALSVCTACIAPPDTPASLPYLGAMRFHSHGPAIPHPLLAAADAGDVVFVCGAGVSLARAGLPTFEGLLDGVVNRLRPAPDGLAAQVLAAEAQLRAADLPIKLPPGFSGIATPDRVFGLLEEEFGRETVERTVAAVLRPAENPDLLAHRTVLRLACGSNDAPRLVTTNFDRLFEMADPKLPVHLPPKLDPGARGIVKLHGSVNAMSDGPEGDGFVLSGAAFGGAYVADGWAARTMRALLERHTVVFLGYAADDPPMQYLLEGLKRIGAPTARAYAFQPGEDAARRWAARGVTAIPYATENRHVALWDTLDSWADRVADAPAWQNTIVDMARRGPRDLVPHERGQVADLLSTTAGAQAFANADDPPPAEWICMLDRRVRYGAPGREAPHRFIQEEPDFDPFALYGLDDDPVIDIDTTQYGRPSRDIPQDAWDGLSWTDEDHAELRARAAAGVPSAYRHGISTEEQAIPPRLEALEAWFACVAGEPAALWWWARRGAPQSSFRWHFALRRDRNGGPTDAWVAWERLLECSDDIDRAPVVHPSMRAHRFQEEIAATGWTDIALRRFEDNARPRLCLTQDITAVPPRREAGASRLAMVRLDVDYRQALWRMSVPDDILPAVVAALGRNLVRFTSLQEAHPHIDLYQLPPFVRHEDPSVNRHQYDDNLGGIVFGYCDKLDRLRECDGSAFAREVALWPHGPVLFDRLRLWQALGPQRSDGTTVAAILAALPNALLWHSTSRRDALHVIRNRWAELDDTQRGLIAQRLASGPDADELSWVEPERRDAVRAWQRLDAIGWLVREGVDLGIDWDRLREQWRSLVPEWDENDVENTVQAFVSRGGAVRTDTDHELLSGVPIEDVVATAAERSGRTDDFLVEANPFLGLVQADPERAREAIRRSRADAATRGKALRTLLTDAADTADRHPLEELLALLGDCSDSVLVEAGWAVGHWIERSSRDREVVTALDALLDRLVHILPMMERSDDTDAEEDDPDYVFRAINAAAGHIAETMMADPRLPDADRRTGLPDTWKARAEALVNLPRPHGDHALTIFAGQAPYLHAHDADWVETHLLTLLDGPRRAVMLAGLSSWHRELPIALFAHVLPSLIAAAVDGSGRRRSLVDWIAAQLLFAWLREDGSLSDDTLDDVLRQASEPFRLAVLTYAQSITEEHHDGAVHDRIVHLLDAVWPRQAALRTEAVMVDLIDVALSGGEDVPRLTAAVMPHLRGLPEWPEIHRFRQLDAAAAQHPLEVLTLLDRIAPEEVARPVYGMDKIVNAIIAAVPDLAGDRRVEKLRRATR